MIFTASALALGLTLCPAPPVPRITCVVDGDTVWINREKIRLIDIDAPEMHGDCPRESRLARASRDRLLSLMRTRHFTIERNGRDRYGRTLARLGDLGKILVDEGLARKWGDRRGWC